MSCGGEPSRSTADGVLVKGELGRHRPVHARRARRPYRLLVVRRSPAASRPPSAFRRVWHGRWYEVWERGGGRPAVAHVGLGTDVDPAAVPACTEVRRLARVAGPGGTIRAAIAAAARRSPASTPARRPAGWRVLRGGSLAPDGHGTGTARATVVVPAARGATRSGSAARSAAARRAAVDGVETGRHDGTSSAIRATGSHWGSPT